VNVSGLRRTAGVLIGAALGLGSVAQAAALQATAVSTYAPVALTQAQFARTWFYSSPPASLVTAGGVPFSLGSANWLHYGDAPATASMDFDKPLAVYLLLNTSFTDSSFAGQTVGTVRLGFSDGTVRETALVVGSNIREWEIGVSWTCHTLSSSSTVSVWQGLATAYQGGAAATIDMLTIPAVSTTAHLTGVTVTNTNSSHMGILYQGLTVLYDPWHRPGNSWDTPAAIHSQAPYRSSSAIFTGINPAAAAGSHKNRKAD